jgi:hypothetical protein
MRAFLPATARVAMFAAATTASFAAPRVVAGQAAASQVVAAPAAAQADVRRPDAPTAAVLVRPAATFRFARHGAVGLPAEVVVADSAGQLVAHYRFDGDCAPRPMAVTVLDTDLVLQAETPSGLLTLRLAGQNAPGSGPVAGRWWLGSANGALRARTR